MSMTVLRQNDGAETWKVGSGGVLTGASTAEIDYLVIEPTTKKAALEAVASAAPSSCGGLPLAEIRFGGYVGDGNISATAMYASSSSDGDSDYDEEMPTMSFDCGGGTKHLTYCGGSQSRRYGTLDAGNAIGWNGKSGDACEIAGVDVPTAQFRLTYTRVMTRAAAQDVNFMRACGSFVGKVNDAAFKGWAAGEVMFLGASFSAPLKGRQKVVVTYNFSVQPNETNVTIAGHSVGDVDGYDYVWTIPRTTVPTSGGAVSGHPKLEVDGVFVAPVCDRVSFSSLGLGN